MNPIGQPERATQDRVIALFQDELGYQYLGDWSRREHNSNIEQGLLSDFLARSGYTPDQIGRALDILKREASKVGLIGTRQTMEMDFYRKSLADMYITTLIPSEEDRGFIEDIIENELIKNYFSEDSRLRFIEIIETLADKGAQAVILGCTEIPLLVKQDQTEVPLIDSLKTHADLAVSFILGDTER